MDHEGATGAAALELRRERIRNHASGSKPAEAAAMIITGIRSFDLVLLLSAAILDQPGSGRAVIDWAGARQLANSFPCPQQAAVELAISLAHGGPVIAVADLTNLDDHDFKIALRAIGHARQGIAWPASDRSCNLTAKARHAFVTPPLQQ